MIKNGRVETGKTPSEISGKPSETIKNGQAVLKNEKPSYAEELFLKALAKDSSFGENPSQIR